MDTTGATAATCLMVAPGGNYINHHQRGCKTPDVIPCWFFHPLKNKKDKTIKDTSVYLSIVARIFFS